jgi:hypothetical protein
MIKEKIQDFLFLNPDYRKIVSANKNSRGRSFARDSEILVEGLQIPPNELVLLHLVPLLEERYGGRAKSYYLLPLNLFGRLKLQIRFSRTITRVITSRKILQPAWNLSRFKLLKDSKAIISEITTLQEIECLSYEGIKYGDLLYDEYLRGFNRHTIELNNRQLIELHAEFLLYLKYFLDHINKVDVKAIVISHHVYKWGLLGRIGVSKGIPVFLVSSESVHHLSSEFQNPYDLTRDYSSLLNQLPSKQVEKGVQEAKGRLEMRFSGITGVDMPYALGSAFAPAQKQKRTLRNSEKIKVLVAVHDFFDAPHVYGDNFYPDFYVWLERIGELSLQTDNEWYIKTHPVVRGNGAAIVQSFVDRYPHFSIIASDVSHLTLISEGVNFVLTVYGTIALEYAHFDIPVINASINNPHNAFQFSITPLSREDYESALCNLKDVHLDISREDIYKYYFMHNLYKLKSIFYYDYDEYLLNVGGYNQSVTFKSVELYLTDFSNRRSDLEVNQALVRFLDSGSKRLELHHFKNSI